MRKITIPLTKNNSFQNYAFLACGLMLLAMILIFYIRENYNMVAFFGIGTTIIIMIMAAMNIAIFRKAENVPADKFHKEEISICLVDKKNGLQVIDDEM